MSDTPGKPGKVRVSGETSKTSGKAAGKRSQSSSKPNTKSAAGSGSAVSAASTPSSATKRKRKSSESLAPGQPGSRPSKSKKASDKSAPGGSGATSSNNAKEGSALVVHAVSRRMWTPKDDYKLLMSIQQVPDLTAVHQAVKFSQPYTYQEVKERWYALLYHEETSRLACAALSTLDALDKLEIAQTALLSVDEEASLRRFAQSRPSSVDESAMAKLLERDRALFLPTRTPRQLLRHYRLMEKLSLFRLSSLVPKPAEASGTTPFSAIEEEVTANVDAEYASNKANARLSPFDLALRNELRRMERKTKRKIRYLEAQLAKCSADERALVPEDTASKFDAQTLAIIHMDDHSPHKMQSKELRIGRCAPGEAVDISLDHDPATRTKVSRLHCVIKLKIDGRFYLTNKGRRTVFAHGRPIYPGEKRGIPNDCVIDICGNVLHFMANEALLRTIFSAL